jgi:hypothetical protein
MPRPRGRRPLTTEEVEAQLSSAEGTVQEFCELIRRTNPTRLPLEAAERARRYELKCRLQSELIRRFGEQLQVVALRDGIVALRLREGRGDGGHTKVKRLSPEARAFVEAQLRTPSSQVDKI